MLITLRYFDDGRMVIVNAYNMNIAYGPDGGGTMIVMTGGSGIHVRESLEEIMAIVEDIDPQTLN